MEHLNFIPSCFTPDQWREWHSAARYAMPDKKSTYCQDCTPEYQARMILENRCAHKCVTFKIMPDEGLCGVRH